MGYSGSLQETVKMKRNTLVNLDWIYNAIVGVGHGLDVGRNRRDENSFTNKKTDIHD